MDKQVSVTMSLQTGSGVRVEGLVSIIRNEQQSTEKTEISSVGSGVERSGVLVPSSGLLLLGEYFPVALPRLVERRFALLFGNRFLLVLVLVLVWRQKGFYCFSPY